MQRRRRRRECGRQLGARQRRTRADKLPQRGGRAAQLLPSFRRAASQGGRRRFLLRRRRARHAPRRLVLLPNPGPVAVAVAVACLIDARKHKDPQLRRRGAAQVQLERAEWRGGTKAVRGYRRAAARRGRGGGAWLGVRGEGGEGGEAGP